MEAVTTKKHFFTNLHAREKQKTEIRHYKFVTCMLKMGQRHILRA